jgi:molybdate transport system ATP-binding protein
MTIYLVVARKENVPSYVDDIIWITPKEDYLAPLSHLDDQRRQAILSLCNEQHQSNSEEIVRFNHVSIRYGERTILNDVNWTIHQGECWALSGQNGSGKSTLLSLICADNPQAYACDIRLFGKQRGTGESIWEIKRRIGYVSPEMHRSYQHNIPAIQVVASGLKDTVGLYTRTNETEREQCRWWMRLFGIESFEQRPFLSLSSGEQRLVLLARAFVKAPQLLILDEPLHGLDSQNRQLVKDIIQTYSQLPGKTLIMVTHYEEELPACFTLRKQLTKHI